MIWVYFIEQKKSRFVALDDVCVESYLYEHYIRYDSLAEEAIFQYAFKLGMYLAIETLLERE